MGLFDSIKKIIPGWNSTKRNTSFIVTKQWVDSSRITFDILDELYDRNGLTHKLINKLAQDRFDKWFTTKTESEELRERMILLNSKKGLNIQSLYKKARQLAMRHGFSLLFMTYRDQADSLAEPVKNPQEIVNLRNIEARFVEKIIFDEDKDSETFGDILAYKINPNLFQGLDQQLIIHSSRVIHVLNDDTLTPWGRSTLKPMYNWLNVFDDMSWSMGQSFFRQAGGFPHLKIKGWEALSDDEKDDYEKQWKQVSSMIGWVGPDGDTIEFVGAEGRALKPKDYIDAGFALIAASGELPEALIRGVNAGQVTGSETNLKDYYSDVSSKQTLEDEPFLEELYFKLQETNQLPNVPFLIDWNPLFEETAKETAETNKLDAETLEILRRTGLQTKETEEEIEQGLLIEIEPTKQENPFQNTLPNNLNPGNAGDKTPAKSAKDIITINRGADPIISKFSKPRFVNLEKRYSRQLVSVFKAMEQSVIAIVKGFETETNDDIKSNFSKITKSIDDVFKVNTPQLNTIANNNISFAFGEGVKSAADELNIPGLSVPAATSKESINVVVKEHQAVLDSLSEQIKKDIEVNLGIFALNPAEKFAEIEQVIKDSFSKRFGQLNTGVGNEINSALNQGNLNAFENSGVVVGKEWVSIIDGVTTDTCIILNGEVVPIGEAFSTGDFAPPAADPPHPCRSSLRAIQAGEFTEIATSDSKIKKLNKSADNLIDLELRKKEFNNLKDKNKLIKDLQADKDGE